MREIRLYGLTAEGRLAFVERLQAAGAVDVQQWIARMRREAHAIEVWDGPVCIHRSESA